MRRTPMFCCFLFAGLLPAGLAAQAAAPDTATVVCPSGLSSATARVCGAALDGVRMLHPVAGLLIAGGNPVLGTADAPGGGRFGRFQLGFRTTTALVVFPDIEYDGTADTVGVDQKLQVLMPTLDIAVGVFAKALPQGTVAIDLLGSALLYPTSWTETFRPVTGSRRVGQVALGFGYGLRAAMIAPGTLPTVSLSVIKRDSPSVTYGSVENDGLAAYTFNVSAISVRLLGGKRWGPFELAAGGGADLLSGNATVVYRDPDTTELQPGLETSLSTMRIATLLNSGLVVGPMRVSGEIGYQIGKNEGLATRFAENNQSSGKFFGGFGVGLKL